ncbi:SxtJ family membrane protein [Kamptonema animale CS-326]|jgi:predicted membrane protein|uniref:SxtJ family membrane protein n=1 Tax=Kamptonema animale TaxID=92934 RepID=UPI00232BE2F8|nr:SxtJ family membrane protein [Kamptonema animale]MDB9511005.1 SxtJ family membrane protein [Kamptonema animale CS-326]
MSNHDQIPKLDNKGLRDFGLLIGGLIAFIFGLLIPLLHHRSISLIPWWPWIICGVMVALALVAPRALNPVYLLWMRFGLVMHAIQTRLILGIVFYLIMLPMGIIKQLFGKDAMQRKLERDTVTYRVPSKVRTKVSMERPF